MLGVVKPRTKHPGPRRRVTLFYATLFHFDDLRSSTNADLGMHSRDALTRHQT